jgi:hypothetical protein
MMCLAGDRIADAISTEWSGHELADRRGCPFSLPLALPLSICHLRKRFLITVDSLADNCEAGPRRFVSGARATIALVWLVELS